MSSSVKRAVSLFLVSFALVGVASCDKEVPGIEEPLIIYCTVLPGELECRNSFTGEITLVPIEEVIGMTCVTPNGLAKTQNHHDALHLKIEELSSERR